MPTKKGRKPMSEEQRKAAGERLAAARAAKAKAREAEASTAAPAAAPQISEEVARMITAEVERLMALNANNAVTAQEKLNETVNMSGARLGAGGVQGIVYKYPLDKGFYPDPTERLYDEPELRRFAMRENFVFMWDVTGETYEKHNITFSEPRFTMELFRKMFDEEGNETTKRILVNRQYMHEDEFAARLAAQKLGIEFTDLNDLLNQVRYYTFKRWLISLFKPVQINTHRKMRTTQVIDGKVVEIYDTEELTAAEAGIDAAAAIERETRLPS